ncbi:phosphotriesterase family protein [Enemella sp. A6]|uniref:phosphotriesterase family protein n=1 Tax=Enemella sp. A6 TaxID=3440152 RepID=UPI003EC0FCE8
MLQTVTGELDPRTVTGPVLAHEHLVVDLRTDTDSVGFLDAAQVQPELADVARQTGLGLVVELSCRGMGRDVVALRRISEATGVPVVAGTGYYYERFHPVGEISSVESVEQRILAEITEGVDDTGIRTGVIGEVGSHGDAPSPAEEISLRASARASARTGTPLATHAHLGRGGLGQLELLLSEGVDPARVAIGHQDLWAGSDQHVSIAREGAYVAFDTIGKASYESDEARLSRIITLMDAGYADRVLLSNDISRFGYLTANGAHGYGHVLQAFKAQLRSRGVDADTLDLLYRRNPLRWLSGVEV